MNDHDNYWHEFLYVLWDIGIFSPAIEHNLYKISFFNLYTVRGRRSMCYIIHHWLKDYEEQFDEKGIPFRVRRLILFKSF